MKSWYNSINFSASSAFFAFLAKSRASVMISDIVFANPRVVMAPITLSYLVCRLHLVPIYRNSKSTEKCAIPVDAEEYLWTTGGSLMKTYCLRNFLALTPRFSFLYLVHDRLIFRQPSD